MGTTRASPCLALPPIHHWVWPTGSQITQPCSNETCQVYIFSHSSIISNCKHIHDYTNIGPCQQAFWNVHMPFIHLNGYGWPDSWALLVRVNLLPKNIRQSIDRFLNSCMSQYQTQVSISKLCKILCLKKKIGWICTYFFCSAKLFYFDLLITN